MIGRRRAATTHARPWTAATLALLALAGTGCQTEVTKGPADEARSTAGAFLADCARGEVTSAADLLTPAARGTFLDDGSGRGACLRFLGLDRPNDQLSPVEQEDLLRRSQLGALHSINTPQFARIAVRTPDGRSNSVVVEQRGDLWELTRPGAPERPAGADPATLARGAGTSFLDLCAHGEYGRAQELLTTSGRADFEAAGADADACLKSLGLTKPKEKLTSAKRDAILSAAAVADVKDVTGSFATLTVTGPEKREGEIEGEDHVTQWELTKPSGTPLDAGKSLLDTCAHEQYETTKDLLTTSTRDAFARHGGDIGACLQLLGLADAVQGSVTEREELLDESDVKDVATTGSDEATVTLEVPGHGTVDVPAERDGAVWKLSAAT